MANPPPQGPRAVVLLGHHEPDYPRNRSVREAFEAAGVRVIPVHSRIPFPARHLALALGLLRADRAARWVFVTEGGHRLVPLVRLLARLTGRRVIFDPFTSRYNTRIEDRRLHGPRSLEALVSLWQDWSSTRAADVLVFDTEEHRRYFYAKYRLRKPYAILPVGVDEAVFAPRDPSPVPRPAAMAEGGLQVFFYGTYIPLQGIEWILEAAARLKGEDVRFTLIGKGQTHPEMRARAEALGLGKVRFLDPVPPEGLVPYLVHADLCLGIFGDTVKAANVVPNKVVQAAAMGKAVVTRDSRAVRGWFRDGESMVLVPPGSGEALAAAILRLKDEPALRAALGAGARRVFEARFSLGALSRVLAGILDAPAEAPPQNWWPSESPGSRRDSQSMPPSARSR